MKICIHKTAVAIELHENSEEESEYGLNVLADINPDKADIGIDVDMFAAEIVRRWNLHENENDKPTNKPNGKPQYYVSICPDSGRQFLVEHGRDNNLVELTMQNAETIRRQFLHKETPTGKFRRQGDLMKFLSDECERYRTEIQTLHPDDSDVCDVIGDYETYDDAKSDFLESLWDVISQHFDV